MPATVTYRGYEGSIIHDQKDRLYYDRLLGIRDMVTYHGATPEEAESIFREAVDEHLRDLEKDGKEPPRPSATSPTKASRLTDKT